MYPSYGSPLKSLGITATVLANINVNNTDEEKKTQVGNSTIYHYAIMCPMQLNLKLWGLIRGVFGGSRNNSSVSWLESCLYERENNRG